MRKAYFSFIGYFIFLASGSYSQNVGIGTTTPQYKLDVRTTENGTAMLLRTLKDSVGASTLLRFTTDAGIIPFPDDQSSFFGNLRSGAGTNLLFGTASNGSSALEKMRLSFQGHLGIGTDDPIGRLHIDMTNTADDRSIVINDDDDPLIELQKAGNARGFLQLASFDMKIGTTVENNAGDFVVRTNGTDRLWVKPYGFVGIGIDNPIVPLHIAGSFTLRDPNPVIRMETSTSNPIGFIQTIGDDIQIGTYATNDLGSFIIRTNGSNRIYVHNNGNVSIGTSVVATGFRVSINGKLMCEELQVKLQNTWPDYVFNSGYKLKSIYTLENYINNNRHLPGIPSAKEMDEKGIGVGEMQRLQMEKIEELTLYIIQLKKEIDALKKEINQKN